MTSGFLGTTTNHPLEFRVNGRRAMRYQYAEDTSDPNNDFDYRSINVLGGSQINEISAGVVGGTIAGGGQDRFNATDRPNRVLNDFGTVGGGIENTSGSYATVAGGQSNNANSHASVIGGGQFNIASGVSATVAGGQQNTASGPYAAVGGGVANTVSGNSSTVGGGENNTARGSNAVAHRSLV